LTAFYTTRLLIMTFGGKPRTAAAGQASESGGSMIMPLVVLSFFAVAAGWSNIPDDFPVFGQLVAALGGEPFWFKDFLGGTLLEKPEALPFDGFVVGTSVVVALGGIALGWWVYRLAWATHDATDPVEGALAPIYPALKNKYWFDELYDTLFVRPTFWLAREFFPAIDRNIIDGALHAVAWISLRIGDVFRDYFDRPVVNQFLNDGSGTAVKAFGGWLRIIQTGRIQQYLIMSAALAAVIAAYLVYASVR
jgi:NADH-quinone oxidoreductase subunit L